MHTHHLTPLGSLVGLAIAVNGALNTDLVRVWSGVALASVCALVSAYVYARQLLWADALKRDAAREEFRRTQELLEAKHKRALAEANGVAGDHA